MLQAMAGAGGGIFLHVSLLTKHRHFLSVSFCFSGPSYLPSLFFLLLPGQWSLGKKEEDLSAAGCRFFTLMLLAVTSAPAITPGLEQALHCLTSNTWPQWVLWARFNSWRRPANEFTFLFSMHIRKMSISHHKWCKWCSTSEKKLMKIICCYISGC